MIIAASAFLVPEQLIGLFNSCISHYNYKPYPTYFAYLHLKWVVFCKGEKTAVMLMNSSSKMCFKISFMSTVSAPLGVSGRLFQRLNA
jgi:hypothetical protein